MSQFLAPYLDSIPLNASIVQMQNTMVGNLTANGWQLLAQVDGSYSDLIPPVTETIGTSTFREVVRLYFPNNTTITIGSYQACIADAYPQSILFTAKTAGAVQAGVTINGVTVLGALGTGTSTANQNLQALYYALMDSVDPVITGWTFAYNGADKLICTAKVPAAMVVCSGNANVTYSLQGNSVLAGALSDFALVDVAHGYSVTTDLTNGFVYYMEVFSRSFSLSTKCISGIYGPIFATYVDHASMLATLPDGGLCTPIELWVGSLAASGLGQAHCTHLWSLGTKYGNHAITNTGITNTLANWNDPCADWNPFSGSGQPAFPSDCPVTYGSTSNYAFPLFDQYAIQSSGLFGSGTSLDSVYKAEPLGIADYCMSTPIATQASLRFFPRVLFPDTYRWVGAEPTETSIFSQVIPAPSTYPTLAQALDATTAYASILLSSTAGLPVQGGFIIGSEGFTYTGISGASVTGVTRGVNGTTQARHFVGHVVSPATWYLRVNNGAICCGPNKPV